MLILIGLGLADGKDISLRGLEAVKSAKNVYLESYTSLLQCSHEELEQQFGVSITRLSREDVEQKAERILGEAAKQDVVVLVIGDPFGATTHADLYLRAIEVKVEVHVIHNASILSAVGEVGLELYRYGKTVSIPYWEKGYEPASFLAGIKENFSRGLHTLCLLDIKVDEKRFMTIAESVDLLEKAEAQVEDESIIHENFPAIGIARLGSPHRVIRSGTLGQLKKLDFGGPPHALIIPGRLHPVEEEMLELWSESKYL